MATTPRKWIGRVQVTTNQTMATTDEEQECVKVEGTACQKLNIPHRIPTCFQSGCLYASRSTTKNTKYVTAFKGTGRIKCQ